MPIAPTALISAELLITVCTSINCCTASWSLSPGYHGDGSPAGIRRGHQWHLHADCSSPRQDNPIHDVDSVDTVLEHNEQQKKCIKKPQEWESKKRGEWEESEKAPQNPHLLKDQAIHSTTISAAAFISFTSFQTHWFALMKDNLYAFEVLFCPLGRMQRLTHTCTNLMFLLSMQNKSPCTCVPNPAIVWPPHEIRSPAWCNTFKQINTLPHTLPQHSQYVYHTYDTCEIFSEFWVNPVEIHIHF